MQKIGDSTSTANGAGEYTQGQPGSGIDATMITAAWLNAVQREVVNVVLGASIALDPGDDSQLLKAIQALQSAASTWAKLAGKPTTVGGFGITDAFTKTETSNAIQQAVAALVASSPAALDTLKELASALGNDPNFATTVTNALAGKASKTELSNAVSALLAKAGGTLSGNLTMSNGTEDSPEIGFSTPSTTAFIDVVNKTLRSFAVCDGVSYTPFLYNLPSATAYAFGSVIWTAANLNPALFATASSAFGVGQTWQDVKASRAANTNYTNTTGRPIQVCVTTADANARSLTVGGVVAAYTNSTYGGNYFLTAIVPPGSTYSYSGTFSNWAELRS